MKYVVICNGSIFSENGPVIFCNLKAAKDVAEMHDGIVMPVDDDEILS